MSEDLKKEGKLKIIKKEKKSKKILIQKSTADELEKIMKEEKKDYDEIIRDLLSID